MKDGTPFAIVSNIDYYLVQDQCEHRCSRAVKFYSVLRHLNRDEYLRAHIMVDYSLFSLFQSINVCNVSSSITLSLEIARNIRLVDLIIRSHKPPRRLHSGDGGGEEPFDIVF